MSKTPEAKSATSKFVMLLPVPLASMVLFVSVSVVARPTNVSVPVGRVRSLRFVTVSFVSLVLSNTGVAVALPPPPSKRIRTVSPFANS